VIKPAKITAVLVVVLSLAGVTFAQADFGNDRGGAAKNHPGGGGSAVDPGVQARNRGTGQSLISSSNDPTSYQAFFEDGLDRFQEVESVAKAANVGLGPRFNSNSCSSCHAFPTFGGAGPAVNPQFQFTVDGTAPHDANPSFISANGPTREARFPFFFNSNGTVNTSAPNGGVEDLFTVTGRPDAGSCKLAQPPFARALAENNVIFRIPTPVFGAGLISRSLFLPVRLTTSRWASPTRCLPRIVRCRKKTSRALGCQLIV
jgi:hypothetical protein